MAYESIATSKEQSERLVKAGLDPDTAPFEWRQVAHGLLSDWCWELQVRNEKHLPKQLHHPPKNPAWSFWQLTHLLPERIIGIDGNTLRLFWTDPFHFEEKTTTMGYTPVPTNAFNPRAAVIKYTEDDPTETIVKLIEWLVANGHSLNKI